MAGAVALAMTQGAMGMEHLAIRSVEPGLYYQHSGTLSEPLTKSFALRNVVIGEGDAKEPSSATLVAVVLAGNPKAFDRAWRVEFTAVSSRTGKLMAHRTGTVGTSGTTAKLRIPFSCGE
jgi:hypothetical protein